MNKIWAIIKAEYLINENASKNWAFVLLLVFFGISIINLSHNADDKVKKIARLNKEVKALRSEYIELKTNVMKRKMASDVYQRLKDNGFVLSKEQPVKLNVVNE